MAHFYGNMKGSRGEVTRCGTRSSGISAYVRGWGYGVNSSMDLGDDGKDCCTITITSGSNRMRPPVNTRITNKGMEAILDGRAKLSVVPIE